MSQKVLLIDGDIVAYASVPPRKVTEDKKFEIIELDSETKKKKIIDYTAYENQIHLERSWNNFKVKLQKITIDLWCDDYLMAVKSPENDNFRDKIYCDYKIARRCANVKLHNPFVPAIRHLSVKEELAVFAYNMEADDLIRIWAMQCKLAGVEYIICSDDKDLDMIPGRHYNIKHNKLYDVSELEAMSNYYQQLIKGDQNDSIPGIYMLGPVKAKKLVHHCRTHEEFQSVVINEYILAYDDKWYDYLLSNGKMIHILRHPTDYFDFSEWSIVKELR